MISTHPGELIALGAAVSWAVTALAFQQATRRAGSLSVNILRLVIAFVLFGFVSLIIRGRFIPSDASPFAWTWLSVSGLVGFVFGDFCLFKSFEYMSARISMLVMAINPLFAAAIGWLALNETMDLKALFAMIITLGGIALVVMERKKGNSAEKKNRNGLRFSYPVKGLLFAFGGAIGQATGLVLSKYGMGDYNVFAATHIRIIAGVIGFILIIFFTKRWTRVHEALRNKKTMLFIGLGAFFGPFIGVFLSLLSIKYTSVGIASSIMSIVPVIIIPPAILLYREKITVIEIIGAIVAVCGVLLYFIV